MLFKSLWAPLGRFGSPFWPQLDFEGGPQIEVFGIDSYKMMKNGVQECVLKKHEFSIDFRCQNERPEVVKVVFLHHACCNLRGLGGHEI